MRKTEFFKAGTKPQPSGRSAPHRSARPPLLIREILARTRSAGFQAYLKDLVVELCRIDTTPNPVVDIMRAAEDGCFRVLERELGALAFPGARLERRPVDPAIQKHVNYSLLHFTKTPERPGAFRRKKPTRTAPTCCSGFPTARR